MSKTGGKPPARPAPAGIRAGVAMPRPGRQPREVFGRFFETLGQLDANGRTGRGGAR
ncbi:hypothetical protein LJR090_005105 [Bosea sp. LjRoot90]|uniref:hypothetical protein n=1 Tax=Bosea sp. LjRoot90 TaxID=3342342 RepID=UPI003ECCC87A